MNTEQKPLEEIKQAIICRIHPAVALNEHHLTLIEGIAEVWVRGGQGAIARRMEDALIALLNTPNRNP